MSLGQPIGRSIGHAIGSSLAGGGGYVDIVREGVLAGFVTYTRADASSCATYFDSAGVMQIAAANIPRKTYDPSTLALRGLMIEEARTNRVLNSATLVTQSVTVAAVAHTLSFYGTGTVTLSGASTAGPLVGTGATNRVTLTFTPTAGSLTLTVTGTCTLGQLEAGALVTSYIPTVGSAVTRAADNGVLSTLSQIAFNATEGTIFSSAIRHDGANRSAHAMALDDSTGNNFITALMSSTTVVSGFRHRLGGGAETNVTPVNVGTNNEARIAFAFKANDFAVSVNGSAVSTNGTLSVPTLNRLVVGARGSEYLNGTIKNLRYYWRKFSPAELQALTA